MSSALAENLVDSQEQKECFLQDLQFRVISGNDVEPSSVYQCVAGEIARQTPLNQTLLQKILSTPKIKFERIDYERITVLFRDAMIRIPTTQPDLFINYAQCAALCMKHCSSR